MGNTYSAAGQNTMLLQNDTRIPFEHRTDVGCVQSARYQGIYASCFTFHNGFIVGHAEFVLAVCGVGELCESCTIIIVRQHGPLGSGTVIWPCTAASNHGIHENPSCDETCPSAGLRTQHFNEHALHTEPCLIPNECYFSPASRSDSCILSTS